MAAQIASEAVRGRAAAVGRAVLAFVAGYVTMLVVSPTITALLRRVWPVARQPSPPNWYLVLDLGYSLGAMALGGFVSAWIARRFGAPLALAGAILVLGLATVVADLDPVHPAWYLWLTALLGPVAVVVGAAVRLRGARPLRVPSTAPSPPS